MSRFAFEEAEEVLDLFATDRKRYAAFRRAYWKFKHMIAAYAYIDYSDGKRPEDEEAKKDALAAAWEDAQMAFTGHGESGLTGAVIQLWSNLRDEEEEPFYKAVQAAFKKAEAATDPDVVRRYLSKYRCKKPRRLEQGFDLPIITPTRGIKLRDWASDAGENPDEIEEQWYWLAVGDRNLRNEKLGRSSSDEPEAPSGEGATPKKAEAKAPTKKKPRLRLIVSPGGNGEGK